MINKKPVYKLLILSFSVLLYTANVSAETKKSPGVTPANKVKPVKGLKPGDTVSGKFVSAFEPEPFVGLKYTFISTSIGGEYIMPVKEDTTEVISIANGYATLLRSGSQREYSEKVVKLSEIRSSGVLQVSFRYDGLTDIAVPFGKFKNATKVSVSNKESVLSMWLVKGIGVVRLEEYDKASKGRIITELKYFRGKKNSLPDKVPSQAF
jgi:hypothetical protein